jgi:hypothetical protein
MAAFPVVARVSDPGDRFAKSVLVVAGMDREVRGIGLDVGDP